ncbi:MAG: transposase [Candidatus Tectomicrobia bacterium]|uniref:Transposase n=1 Tax=Tectimicrobiota bacterium TaxID=2528274 RepID=A0A933LQ41_UNCTE|nr:transposase [Candidatus Tectomicrobia bacterium]
MVSTWHAFLLTGFSRQELWLATALIRGRMKHCCLHYQNSQDKAVRSRATRMLKNWDHLFTFLSHEGVEPTNNAAERAQRHAVQWHKICFSNQSDEEVNFTERILTVIRTCKLQGKNPFQFLSQVMDAAFNGTPRPSLVLGAP